MKRKTKPEREVVSNLYLRMDETRAVVGAMVRLDYLPASECRRLAAWLLKAAEWIESKDD
jgi:hypothetical protein